MANSSRGQEGRLRTRPLVGTFSLRLHGTSRPLAVQSIIRLETGRVQYYRILLWRTIDPSFCLAQIPTHHRRLSKLDISYHQARSFATESVSFVLGKGPCSST